MDIPFLITLLFLGLGGGFLSGLLGLGGAIFMIPLLLYVPPLMGVGQLDMKQVAAVSMVQVLSASLSGLIVHNKNRFVSKSLLLYMGLCNALGNLAGSLFSKYTKSAFLLAIFATMAVIAAIVMFVPKREQGED
ncbi:MAG: sulfite exporter TauE/SafE family protein, partial [Nitrospirota bacterium]